MDDSPKGERGEALNDPSNHLVSFTREMIVLISWTLKFTQLIARNLFVGLRNGRYMPSVLPVLPATPMADSTNRSQHRQSPDVVRNLFRLIPEEPNNWKDFWWEQHCFWSSSTLGDWKRGVQGAALAYGAFKMSDFFFFSNTLNSLSFLLNFLTTVVAFKAERF